MPLPPRPDPLSSRAAKRVLRTLWLLPLAVLATSALGQQAPAAGAPVAGLQPDRRPARAPVETARPATPAQLEQRLTGVTRPWPKTVEQAAVQQGGWFSPLFHPGMTGPYDLRGWHRARP